MIIYYNSHLKDLARDLRNHMTFAEKVVWNFLKKRQLLGYDFHRQKPIGNYIADFYCSALKLVIEIDGITHTDPEVQEHDRVKDEYFKNIGLDVLRFTDEEVLGNGNKVEEAIKEFAHRAEITR